MKLGEFRLKLGEFNQKGIREPHLQRRFEASFRRDNMKIAQIAPLMESVPPRLYGGTERIVSYLVEELVEQGHNVTLFASADSLTAAQLLPCCPQSLRLNPIAGDPIAYNMGMVEKVRSMASQFDILHFHIDPFHFPIFRDIGGRTVTTLHGRQDRAELKRIYAEFPQLPLVSLSWSQRVPIAAANLVGTVPHGLPTGLLPPTLHSRGGYLAFLGRISPEKGVDRAISVARAVGLPLKIAAKVGPSDERYFRTEIEPLLHQPGIEFVGEIDDRRKALFLGNALALLFLIDWPEPFGLAMIEAMSCGTPVLAFRNGAVPEVIDDGLTGYIVQNWQEAVCKMGSLLALDRGRIRRCFVARFAASRMARDYVKLYQDLLTRSETSTRDRLPVLAEHG